MDDDVIMAGPNLTLADLRWLVARCEDMPGRCRLSVTGLSMTRYETITVHAGATTAEAGTSGTTPDPAAT